MDGPLRANQIEIEIGPLHGGPTGVEALLRHEHVWTHILQFLPVRDASRLAQVSTAFAVASCDDGPWAAVAQHSFTPLTSFVMELAGISDHRLPCRTKLHLLCGRAVTSSLAHANTKTECTYPLAQGDYVTLHVARKQLIESIGVEDVAGQPDAGVTEALDALQAQQLVQRIGHLIFGPLYWLDAGCAPLAYLVLLGLKLEGELDASWAQVFSPMFVLLSHSFLNAWAAAIYIKMGGVVNYTSLSPWYHYRRLDSAGPFFYNVMPFLTARVGSGNGKIGCWAFVLLMTTLTLLPVTLTLKLEGNTEMSYGAALTPLWVAFVCATVVVAVRKSYYFKEVVVALLFELGQLLSAVLLAVALDGDGISVGWALFPALIVGCGVIAAWLPCELEHHWLLGAFVCWAVTLLLLTLEANGSIEIGPVGCMSPLLLLAFVWYLVCVQLTYFTGKTYWDEVASVQYRP